MTIIFNAAHRAKSDFVCSAGGIGRLYTVNFVNRQGPKQPVDVTPGCRPEMTNGYATSNDTGTVLAVLRDLTGPG
ncbi:MAG: hypothetical protein M3070_09055 [Actinomycetota bacterium]|nr:hypothetical protein [Actinomycetota bacterium]